MGGVAWTQEEIDLIRTFAGQPLALWRHHFPNRTNTALHNRMRSFTLKKRAALWSPQDDAILLANPAMRGEDLAGRFPGRTPQAIDMRRRRLGLVKRAENRKSAGKYWTAAEDEFLRQTWVAAENAEATARALSKHFGHTRSARSCARRAGALGLPMHGAAVGLVMLQTIRIEGIDPRAVASYAKRKGWARRLLGSHGRWCVTPEQAEEIKTHFTEEARLLKAYGREWITTYRAAHRLGMTACYLLACWQRLGLTVKRLSNNALMFRASDVEAKATERGRIEARMHRGLLLTIPQICERAAVGPRVVRVAVRSGALACVRHRMRGKSGSWVILVEAQDAKAWALGRGYWRDAA